MAHSKKKHTSPLPKKKSQQRKEAAKQERIVNIGAIVLGICLIVLIAVIIANSGAFTFTSSSTGTEAGTTSASTATFLPGDGATLDNAVATHTAVIEIKDYGTIQLELYGNTAPLTVENFVSLAKSGFYNGTTFHRIVEGFMMQGGAPLNGDANSVQKISGEFSANGFENNLLHKRGVISMARASSYNSASSQFFIMHTDKTHLDGEYAAFGRVIEGIDVVDNICSSAKPIDGNGGISTDQQPIITSITITELS